MITELLAEDVPVSAELPVAGFPVGEESPADFRPERHDPPPQTVDWDAVDAQRYGLFP